ncbi:MAG: hypothetical protein J6R92_05050 [Akkermansia sp.]|nr:hypothetical protein [Akkermansia sp.]
MSARLIKLLTASFLFFCLGIALFPVFFPTKVEKKTTNIHQGSSIVRETKVDDWSRDDESVDDSDSEWVEDTEDTTVPERRIVRQDDETFNEDDVPLDAKQNVVPAARVNAQFSSIMAAVRRLIETLEKQEGDNFIGEDLNADAWGDPEKIYFTLAEKIVGKLGKMDDEAIIKYMSAPENRLDLARATLIRKAGSQGVRSVSVRPKGKAMLHALTSDLNWMTNLLYSGPTKNLETALCYLETIYGLVGEEELKVPATRRIATTTALEFAREGWNEKDMLSRFKYYNDSWKEGKLNSHFDNLQYWETRFVTGCKQPSDGAGNWGSARNLAWHRDNVRLPMEQYLGAECQLEYRLRNVAGDSVFSAEYLAPIWKYVNFTTGWAYREIGGVCGALSHYATFSALAAGLPASTMGEPGHCAYAMRIGNEWKRGNSIYWQHGLHKTFWGEPEWGFLYLTQKLYEDRFRTCAADQLVAMADLLTARRKMKSAFSCYEVAVKAQPNNWPALKRYAAYLKLKAPTDLSKWMTLHDAVMDGMGKEHYHAAATMQSRYVYPMLAPLIKDRGKLNKMYSGLFNHFKDWGANRWDIAPVLDAQIATCQTDDEKAAYLREVLRVLMRRPDYSGAVLTWGLGYIARMPEGDGKIQEDFTNMLVQAMSRAGTSSKQIDETWATLGEAIHAAAKNKERRTFQAIGRLAYRKCKKRFPKKGPRIKGFSGVVVSASAWIDTATTIGDMSQCCLHWGVLQRHGGAMPGKFEGKAGLTVGLEKKCDLNGVLCLSSEQSLKKDRPFYIEVSDDGQNWTRVRPNGVINGNEIRFNLKGSEASGKFVRMLREGDKYEPGITGFYVYGKPQRNQ